MTDTALLLERRDVISVLRKRDRAAIDQTSMYDVYWDGISSGAGLHWQAHWSSLNAP